MHFLTTILPATVIAAIILFVVREVLEAYRRHNADKRKKEALRRLLARECERNHAAINSLKQACSSLKEFGSENHEGYRFRVSHTPSGHLRFERRITDEEVEAHFILRPVQQEIMQRVMVEVAALDVRLFETLEESYDAIAEVRHIRDSLIDYLSDDSDKSEDIFLLGFCDYAIAELEEAYREVSKLYRECTGEDLKKVKLR